MILFFKKCVASVVCHQTTFDKDKGSERSYWKGELIPMKQLEGQYNNRNQ